MGKVVLNRNITPETMAESARLKVLWDNREDKLSQAEFGEKYEIGNQSAVSQFLNGKVQLNLKVALSFAEGLGCQISDFSIRLAKEAESIGKAVQLPEPDGFQSVDMLNIEVSAGGGRHLAEVVEAKGSLHFRRDYLREEGINPKHAAIVKVKGESMEPTIYGGALILINQSDTSPKSGNVYAFVYDNSLLVKRFFIGKGRTWIARSDNMDKDKFKDIVLDGSVPFRMLGRAVWVGMKM